VSTQLHPRRPPQAAHSTAAQQRLPCSWPPVPPHQHQLPPYNNITQHPSSHGLACVRSSAAPAGRPAQCLRPFFAKGAAPACSVRNVRSHAPPACRIYHPNGRPEQPLAAVPQHSPQSPPLPVTLSLPFLCEPSPSATPRPAGPLSSPPSRWFRLPLAGTQIFGPLPALSTTLSCIFPL
jgi:hypothetical protein